MIISSVISWSQIGHSNNIRKNLVSGFKLCKSGVKAVIESDKVILSKANVFVEKAIFVGYAKDSKSYRCLDLDSNIIVESKDADFFENKFCYDSTSTNEIVTQILQDIFGPNLNSNNKRNMAESSSAPRRSERVRKERNSDSDFIDSQAIIFLVEGDNETNVINKIPVLLNVEDAPKTYKEAITSRNFAFWNEAIDDEIDSLGFTYADIRSGAAPTKPPLILLGYLKDIHYVKVQGWQLAMVNMHSLRSKKDDVQKISSSVFVTNFPEQFSAKDLWNTCKVYGHVVDTYIPDRRSKIGKRFAFVRFINVFDMTCWLRVIEVPRWVPDFEDDCDDDDFKSNDGTQVVEGPGENVGKCSDLKGESDSEAILETRFEDEPMDKFDDINSIPHSKPQSKDPFGVYELLNKKKKLLITKKLNHTISDYCTLVRGVWVPNGRNMLIILIYAPQELSEKRTLWDYLCFTICNWDGDVVTMGDFNEVRDSSGRFDSVFNKQGAKLFNDFIAKASLTEVPLGGCIFTRCHKMASKMRKLDHFLVSDSLLCNCPRISSVTLDRKNTLKTELTNLDSVLDRGEGIYTDVTRRSDVVRILQDIEKTEAMKVAQKAKIKWAVEGDENSKYYHGVINKKRNNLAIRGVLVDGNRVESPQLVKNEFYAHFKQRLKKLNLSGIQFD
nr:RNA-directed DNA polymerase, eukaryota [Tanacetum cinerariifolium]